MGLSVPLPAGVKVVRVVPGLEEPAVTVVLTLPLGVMELLAQALDYARQVTGSDRVGAQFAAIGMEVIGEWQAQVRGLRPPSFDACGTSASLPIPAGSLSPGFLGLGGVSDAVVGLPTSVAPGPMTKAPSAATVDGPCLDAGDGIRRICLWVHCGGLYIPTVPWQSHCSNTCRRLDWSLKARLRQQAQS